jgi:diguanylate cyclase (GGDEF)-like protein
MSDRSNPPDAVLLRRDPVILAILGLGGLAAGWYLVGWDGHWAGVTGFGICRVVLNLVLAAGCRRVARMPGLSAPIRRFWTAFGVGSLCAGAADLIQVFLDLLDPVPFSAVNGTAHQIGVVIGLALPIWAMLTLPNGSHSRREQLRFWLDASTVMVGAAAFAWYFSVSASISGDDNGSSAGPMLIMGMELVACFAVVKLLLTGAAGFVSEAAFCGAVGAGLEGVSSGIIPTLPASPWLPLLVAAQMLPTVMIVSTARIQELRVRSHPELMAPQPKRPYSLLPYLAVAATLALLVVAIAADGGIVAKVWGVLIGVVVSTGLVVARQLAALAENASLLTQLETSFRELRRHEQLLRHQASHDHLTQLANRCLFTERAGLATDTATDQMTVVMIDLDDFKAINDTLGHHIGDAVLVAVADRLRACVRPGDTVARLGGDEFAMLLPTATGADTIGISERITAALTEPMLAHGHLLHIHASIGLATGTSDDPEALLRDADHAMYITKRDRKAAGIRSREVARPSDLTVN